MPNTLVIVPARSGSKGLPGKNLAHVGGIPLIARAVRTARQGVRLAGFSGRVICSTDDSEIAATARLWGAEVPFLRSASLAADDSPMIDVLIDAIDRLDVPGETAVVLVQPTSPLVAPEDISLALRTHRESGFPVVGVSRVRHPVEWVFEVSSDGHISSLDENPLGRVPTRRQDAADLVRICGAVYVATASSLKTHRSFIQPDAVGLLIPDERAVDVDSATDLNVARALVAQSHPDNVMVGATPMGGGHAPFVIAEAGVNHNGDLELAKRLVDAAKASGAHAVKFQTFKTGSVVSPGARQARYQRQNTGKAESQFEMIRRFEFQKEQTVEIRDYCRESGIEFLSSPFDVESAELLVSLEVPLLKVGSGEITNLPFLSELASCGKPLLLSTGMSSMDDIASALETINSNGAPPVALMHCVSSYPAPKDESNLAAIATLREAFGVPVGWSDHTSGIEIAVAAVALGACAIEKHLTLDRSMEGPDHRASLEPWEFERLTQAVSDVVPAVGDGIKRRMPSEEDCALVARRSLFARCSIRQGSTIGRSSIVALRPGTGIPPGRIADVIGATATRDIQEGEMIQEGDYG